MEECAPLPGTRWSSSRHSTLGPIATSLAHLAALPVTNTMRRGPTYWFNAATASRVTHVGLTPEPHSRSLFSLTSAITHSLTHSRTHALTRSRAPAPLPHSLLFKIQ